MSAILSAYVFLLLHAQSPITLNVNAASGDVLTGTKEFKVTVIATEIVNQVEFYVNSDLRDNATATPYLFKLDTLGENDGPLTLKFKAYCADGKTAEKTINVTINNGVSLGAEPHIKKALDLLNDSKWDLAVTEGRIALKADEKSVSARIVLSRAYLGLKMYDKAQKFAEDAVALDPKNPEALALVSGVNVKRVLNTVVKEGQDRSEVLNSMKDGLEAAIKTRRAVLDAAVDSLPANTSSTKVADVALPAGRYSFAEEVLRPDFERGEPTPALTNRLAYSLLKLNRYKDAYDVTARAKKLATIDAYGYALMAIAAAELDSAPDSDAAIAAGLKLDSASDAIKCAQAYIALKFVRQTLTGSTKFLLNYDDRKGREAALKVASRKELTRILEDLSNELGNRTEVLYYLQALNSILDNYASAETAFQDAVLAEPANADAYIEQGNRTIAVAFRGKQDETDKQNQFDYSAMMFGCALTAQPSSPSALAGLSITATLKGDPETAIRWGEAAVKSNSTYAPAQVVLGIAYNVAVAKYRKNADALRKRNNSVLSSSEHASNENNARQFEQLAAKYVGLASDAMRAAGLLDPRIAGYSITDPFQGWRYYSTAGRQPVMILPTK